MSDDTVSPQPPSAEPGGGYTPPPPPPPASPAAPDNRKLMIVLAYLWILALIPYLTEQKDPEVKWHARHGLVLLGAEILLNVVIFILSMIPGVGCLFSILSMIVWLGIIALHIVMIIKAVNGERLLIPGVSHYADQIP